MKKTLKGPHSPLLMNSQVPIVQIYIPNSVQKHRTTIFRWEGIHFCIRTYFNLNISSFIYFKRRFTCFSKREL